MAKLNRAYRGHRHLRVNRLKPSLTRPCRLRTIKVECITAVFLHPPLRGKRGKRPARDCLSSTVFTNKQF